MLCTYICISYSFSNESGARNSGNSFDVDSRRCSSDIPDSRRSSEDTVFGGGSFSLQSNLQREALVPVMSPISEFSCDYLEDGTQGIDKYINGYLELNSTILSVKYYYFCSLNHFLCTFMGKELQAFCCQIVDIPLIVQVS